LTVDFTDPGNNPLDLDESFIDCKRVRVRKLIKEKF
jgi:hypothetical protein